MFKENLRKTCIVLTYALAFSVLGLGQDVKTSFTLTVSSSRQVWKSSEPIHLDATVQNLTDLRLHLSSSQSAWENGEIFIRDANGVPVPPIEDPSTVRRSFPSIFIEGGKTLKESFNISRQFDLAKPGQYYIQIEKKDPTTKIVVKSNTLVLTVTP
jgi:hypothetical protein